MLGIFTVSGLLVPVPEVEDFSEPFCSALLDIFACNIIVEPNNLTYSCFRIISNKLNYILII